MAQDIVIGGRLHSAATGNTVAGANEILDDAKGKKQNVINQEVDNEIGSDSAAGTIKGRIKNLETAVGSGGSVDERIAETKAEIIGDAADDYNTLGKVEDKIQETKSEILGDAASDYNTLGKVEDKIQAETSRAEAAEGALDNAKANKATTLEGYGIIDAYTKNETYTKTEVNGLVDTPHQNYVTVLTYAALIAIDPGSTDTIYRVSNYDGSVPQVDVTKYSEYAWDGTQYVFLCVKSQIDEVFDISVYNNNATYADLAAALGTDGANVPQTLRRGGMSVKYVQNSDNTYVQYRLMKNQWSTTESDWQGIDTVPKVISKNLVDGEGLYKFLGLSVSRAELHTGYYITQYGSITSRETSSYITFFVDNFKSIRLIGNAVGGNTSTIVFLDAYGEFTQATILGKATYTGAVDATIQVPTGTKMIALNHFNDTENLYITDVVYAEDSAIPEMEQAITDMETRLEDVEEVVIGGMVDYTSRFTESGFLDTDGQFSPLSLPITWATTDFIECTPGSLYKASLYAATNTACLAFYAADKSTVVDVVIPEETGSALYTDYVPNGAAYMRSTNKNNSYSDFYLKIQDESISQKLHSLEDKCDEIDGIIQSESNYMYKYHHNLQKPYVFNNKAAVFFGDSITYGVYSSSGGVDEDLTHCYRAYLCDMLNLTGTNKAVSGSYICDLEDSANSILNKVLDNISASSNYDFIFIAGGINDYWTGKPIGTPTDNTYATFYGALNVMCSHLDTALSGKDTKVIFLLPINYSKNASISNVAELGDYRNAIFEVATIHGYGVVDTSVIGFPSEKDDTTYKQAMIYDGVHPTIAGHLMMAQNIASILL